MTQRYRYRSSLIAAAAALLCLSGCVQTVSPYGVQDPNAPSVDEDEMLKRLFAQFEGMGVAGGAGGADDPLAAAMAAAAAAGGGGAGGAAGAGGADAGMNALVAGM